MDDIVDPALPLIYNTALAASWLTKMQTGGASSLMTPQEHNAGLCFLAILLDTLSDPLVVAKATTAGLHGYVFIPYAGPFPVGTAASTSGVSAGAIPIYGLEPAPTQPDRLMYWNAWAEITSRIASRWHRTLNGANWPPVDVTKQWLAELTGPAKSGAFQDGSQAPGTWIQEDPDVVGRFATLWTGTQAFALRISQIALSATPATPPAALLVKSSAELVIERDIQAIADQRTAEKSKARNYALYGLAGIGIAETAAVVKRGIAHS